MLITTKLKQSTHNTTTLFHLVDLSPWPFITSTSLYILLSGLGITFNNTLTGVITSILGLVLLVSSAGLWFRDVCREGYRGEHTVPVTKGIKLGFSLFIISEVLLFVAFFWALAHSSLTPSVELGNLWPPLGIDAINPWNVPILNGIILLSSGVSISYAHHALISSNYNKLIFGLYLTIGLALIFLLLMIFEYRYALYTISDGVYGSCFYILTGLHGLHIIVAIIFLYIGLQRAKAYAFSNLRSLGLELAIIYYHFVDLVFLFVFTLVYWWNSGVQLEL